MVDLSTVSFDVDVDSTFNVVSDNLEGSIVAVIDDMYGCVSAKLVAVVVGTAAVSFLCTQQLPNMNVSTHTPTCVPSDLMHSQTNMHVPWRLIPLWPGTRQGFGLIL